MNDPDIDDLIPGLQDTVSFVNKFLENNAQKNTDEDDIKDAALLSDGPAPASMSGNNGESLYLIHMSDPTLKHCTKRKKSRTELIPSSLLLKHATFP